MMEWTPNTFSGTGFSSPTTSIVDVGGETLPSSTVVEIIERYSRSRTLRVCRGDVAHVRDVNYRNWLL